MSSITEEDLDLLNLTTKVRRKIVEKLTANNSLPEDSEDREFLMKAMDGLDKQIFTKARIKNDEAANKTQEQNASLIGQLLSKITPSKFSGNIVEANVVTPTLPESLSAIETVYGETDVGVQNLNMATFEKLMEEK